MIRKKPSLAALTMMVLFSVTSAQGADWFPADAQKIAVEREKRLLQLAGDKLASSTRLVQEDIAVLERDRDALTPAEPPRREEELSDLLDWQYRHAEFFSDQENTVTDLMTDLSAPGAPPEPLLVFDSMADKERGFAVEMVKKVERYAAERDRVAELLERRQRLIGQAADLKEKLLRRFPNDGEGTRPERDQEEERRLKLELKLVQAELSSLPPELDEAMRRHYVALVEYCQWQKDWLQLEVDAYDALGSVAALAPSSDQRDYPSLLNAHKRLARTFESQVVRLKRMEEEIDRKRTRVVVAGSFQEAQRSRFLNEMFDRLKERIDNRIRELKVNAGASEAEMAQLRSAER
ncbi:MAG TPA: hypothetical protein VJ550_05945 [Geomonas sp.]|nr:hypothetical protein [Geomonas sp.]